MPELTVSAGMVRGLMQLCVSKGACQATLAERSRLELASLEDQDNRIPFANYMALMRAGKECCGDPALALHYGEVVDLSEVSIVGLLGHASETMMDAFQQLNRFGRLVVEVEVERELNEDRFKIVQRGDEWWMLDCRKHPNAFPELTEATFARMICGTRRFGTTAFVQRVHVTHGDPGYRDEYERIFQAPVAFDCTENAMLIDPSWLTRPIALAPRYVFGILSAHADTLLKSLEDSKSVRGQVECLLMALLHTGEVSIDAIAKRLAVSRQTLFRRLKAEGVTFEQVLDELRHTMAVDYLAGRKSSVNETAYLVGFSDPAAFSRAFKRWTGVSPSQMRQRA